MVVGMDRMEEGEGVTGGREALVGDRVVVVVAGGVRWGGGSRGRLIDRPSLGLSVCLAGGVGGLRRGW